MDTASSQVEPSSPARSRVDPKTLPKETRTTAATANTFEPLCSLSDCGLILDRRHSEILLTCEGQKSSHFDPCIALAVAQGLLAACRSKEPGMIVQIPRFNAKKPMAPVEYFTRIWVDSDARIFVQTQGPHNGPAYAFDIWETITLVQGLISGVRASQGWR